MCPSVSSPAPFCRRLQTASRHGAALPSKGDAEFASAISRVAANIEWDVEEDLSRVFGDIAAHRLAQAGRSAAAWPKQAAQSLAASASEYLTEEAKLLVTPLQAAEFVREVDELRDAVERLEKRIDRLTRGR